MAVVYEVRPRVSGELLNELFEAAWDQFRERDWAHLLERSLGWVCAYDQRRLIGFVYLAGDGGLHAFLLDPTVHPDYRRRGIGRLLVGRAVELARDAGADWLHVDFEPHLTGFYQGCGFRPTPAGVIRLQPR
jgi:GNAT superfamily N-acetyltransferase